MSFTLTTDSWATARRLMSARGLDGEWCKVTSDEGRVREGYARIDPDGTLIVVDDNGDAAIFDRDHVAEVEV